MKGQATEAIVLRCSEFRESSLVVQLFTREFGRVAGLARGARRLKQYRAGALDQLCVSRIVLRRRSSRGLALIDEARLLQPFEPLTLPYRAALAGFLVARLLLDFVREGLPQADVFRAAVDTLATIRSGGNWELRAHRFVWELIVYSGYGPRLDRCARCNRPLPRSGRLRFCPLAGGLLCPSCPPLSRVAASLSAGTAKLLGHLTDVTTTTWQSLRVQERLNRELWRVEAAVVRALAEQPVHVMTLLAPPPARQRNRVATTA